MWHQLYAHLLWLFLAGISYVGCDQPPRFTNRLPLFDVNENEAKGTVLYTLDAEDADIDDTLIFSYTAGLGEDEKYLLRLSAPRQVSGGTNTWKCDIILNGTLDRDNRPSTRTLFYQVFDGTYYVPYRVSLIINDVNDNPPAFTSLPYRTSVDETASVDTTVFKVSATDPDLGKGGRIIFSMKANNEVDEAEYQRAFRLNGNSGDVTVLGPLDYIKQSFYHFKVSARDDDDKPCPGDSCLCNSTISPPHYCDGEIVDLFITILDEQNTPPVFEKLPYFATINESLPVDSPVIHTLAVDGDRGVARPNNISYSLNNDSFIPFQINEMSGIITVGQALDADDPNVRLRGGLYIFYVNATEMADGHLTDAHSSTRVTIIVTDVNDNEPKFEQPFYEAKVIENTPQGAPLSMTSTIRIEDIDQAENSQFQIFIETESGEADTNFITIPSQNETVQGSTTVTILVLNSTLLDYERTKNLTIKLVARERRTDGATPGASEATVHITIEDANDHNPDFLTRETVFEVRENVTINHLITTIHADDRDSGDFGVVMFSLEDSGSNATFKMSENGSLTVVGALDREKLEMYSLMVVAMDNPNAMESQRRRSLMRISVRVLDVNDNDPVWPEAVPSYSVSETDEIGQNVGYLRATDDDVGLNGQLEYSLQSGTSLFGVNKTSDGWANLFVNQKLAGHSGNQNVTIIATDRGDEARSAKITVTVLIIDVNIHSPEFVQPGRNITNWTLNIEEELSPGTVIANFSAKDEDKWQNGAVEYILLPSSNRDSDRFGIDRRNGSLRVVDRLDREDKDFYEITVQAKDNGQPTVRSSSLKVLIKLTDIDDNKPIYGGINMPFMMSVEEENATAVIGSVHQANDSDSDPKNKVVCYYLYGGDHIDYFVLHKTNRVLSLQKKLDWETTKTLNIVIKASSNCSEQIIPSLSSNPGTSSPEMYNPSDLSQLWIKITVTDVNDHGPKFTHQDFTTGVLFDADLRTVVLSLTNSVLDDDSLLNKKNSFRLLDLIPSPEMQQSLDTKTPAFSLSKNGNITTAIRFRPDMLGFFLLKVQVYDSDGLNDTTQVKIYIVSNLQRVKLVFSRLPNEVEMLKESLLKELSEILGFQIIADKIVTHTNPDGTTDPTKTDVFIHGRYDNGEVVSASKLWRCHECGGPHKDLGIFTKRAFDFNPAASSLLSRSGVLQAEDLQGVKNNDNGDDNARVFVIIIAVLAISLTAVSLVFLNMMRIYRRRLKAATTKAFASPKEQEMFEHPGTNKYYSAENPLFGKEIKNSELEDEKLSANSLDINAVDQFSKSNPEPEEEQEVVLQITDSALSTPQHHNHGHLDKVLQEYDNSIKSKGHEYEATSPGHIPSKKLLSGRRPGTIIPGLGIEIQEGVTRFSDENLSGDSGFPDGENGLSMSKGYLEYSDI